MIEKLKRKIEKKRTSKNLFWRLLVFGKDFIWKYILHNPIPSHYNILMYDLRLKLHKNTTIQDKNVKQKKRIHIVYFACKKHFKYLIISLKSLEKLHPMQLGNIYIFVDKKDFLTKDQIILLKKLKLNVVIKKSPIIAHDGVKLIITELTAFKEVINHINENDYIAKIDSDILFISDEIFKNVVNSSAVVIGQKSGGNPATAFPQPQGGCYFIRAPLINKMTNHPLRKFIKEASNNIGGRLLPLLPEDFVIFNLAKKHTNNIELINFSLPLNKIYSLPKKQKQYSVIHFFSRHKEQMPQVAKKFDTKVFIKKIKKEIEK